MNQGSPIEREMYPKNKPENEDHSADKKIEHKKFVRESIFDLEELARFSKEADEEMERFRPHMQDFESDNPQEGYTREAIEDDMSKIEAREEEWKREETDSSRESKQLSIMAEYAFFKYFRIWSNGKIQTVMPSKYDDVMRAIDIVLEFPEAEKNGEKYTALAVDVVLGSGDGFVAKLMKIKKFVIDKGLTKSNMKYFRADGKNLFSEFMAPAVASLNALSVGKLFDQELEEKTANMEKSEIPYVTTLQLLAQYKGFEEDARSIGQEEIADCYKNAYNNLEKASRDLLADLAIDPVLNKKVENDFSLKAINIFFKELKSGKYKEDAENIIKERELLEKESNTNNENYEVAA